MPAALIPQLAARAEQSSADILADIDDLVACETSSYDLHGLAAGLDLLTALAAGRLGAPTHTNHHPGGDYGHTALLTYQGSAPGHVALVGHYDTVWPTGTLADWQPSAPRGASGRPQLSGPGIFDMKAGLVQGIWALKLLRDSGYPTPTVTFVFNGDEEIGSPSSRTVIEQAGTTADATVVLEPSVDGAVKTARKGVGLFTVTATGVQAHAGLDPEAGASAIHALAEFITAAIAVADPSRGTTINVGLISGGSGTNVIAGRAEARLDIRVRTHEEQQRVDTRLDAIKPSDPRVRFDIDHAWNRPPMTLNAASAPLLEAARSVAAELGHSLDDVAVGGASDANFVADLGRPVLCGMGAVGGGAHARGEYIYPDSVPHQTALVAGLLYRLTNGLTHQG